MRSSASSSTAPGCSCALAAGAPADPEPMSHRHLRHGRTATALSASRHHGKLPQRYAPLLQTRPATNTTTLREQSHVQWSIHRFRGMVAPTAAQVCRIPVERRCACAASEGGAGHMALQAATTCQRDPVLKTHAPLTPRKWRCCHGPVNSGRANTRLKHHWVNRYSIEPCGRMNNDNVTAFHIGRKQREGFTCCIPSALN